MTNEELNEIKTRLQAARADLQQALSSTTTLNRSYVSTAESVLTAVLTTIKDVQERAIKFGKGPDCYNCKCKDKCERYA
jgi:hypothetical protein